MRHFKNLINSKLRKQLYFCTYFSFSRLRYFPMGNLPEHQYYRLKKLLNASVRYLWNIKFPTRFSPDRIKFGWLIVKLQAIYLSAVHIYNILNIGKATYLKEKVKIYISPRDLRLKNCPNLVVNSSTNQSYNNSSLVFMISFWYSFPEEIRLSSSIDVFKSNHYEHHLEIDKRELNLPQKF